MLTDSVYVRKCLVHAATNKNSSTSRRSKQNSNGLLSIYFHALPREAGKQSQVNRYFHQAKKANKRFRGI